MKELSTSGGKFSAELPLVEYQKEMLNPGDTLLYDTKLKKCVLARTVYEHMHAMLSTKTGQDGSRWNGAALFTLGQEQRYVVQATVEHSNGNIHHVIINVGDKAGKKTGFSSVYPYYSGTLPSRPLINIIPGGEDRFYLVVLNTSTLSYDFLSVVITEGETSLEITIEGDNRSGYNVYPTGMAAITQSSAVASTVTPDNKLLVMYAQSTSNYNGIIIDPLTGTAKVLGDAFNQVGNRLNQLISVFHDSVYIFLPSGRLLAISYNTSRLQLYDYDGQSLTHYGEIDTTGKSLESQLKNRAYTPSMWVDGEYINIFMAYGYQTNRQFFSIKFKIDEETLSILEWQAASRSITVPYYKNTQDLDVAVLEHGVAMLDNSTNGMLHYIPFDNGRGFKTIKPSSAPMFRTSSEQLPYGKFVNGQYLSSKLSQNSYPTQSIIGNCSIEHLLYMHGLVSMPQYMYVGTAISVSNENKVLFATKGQVGKSPNNTNNPISSNDVLHVDKQAIPFTSVRGEIKLTKFFPSSSETLSRFGSPNNVDQDYEYYITTARIITAFVDGAASAQFDAVPEGIEAKDLTTFDAAVVVDGLVAPVVLRSGGTSPTVIQRLNIKSMLGWGFSSGVTTTAGEKLFINIENNQIIGVK